MKELDTYKAEIFHRSQVKIKQRRKRRIALGAGLSLCLCLFATAVFLGLPPEVAKMDSVAEMAPDCAAPIPQVLVQGQGENLSVTDPETVSALRLLLIGYSEACSDQENGSVSSNQSVSDTLKDQAGSRVITLIWEGQAERFRLTGRQLLREATGDSRILTPEEYEQLEALLEKCEQEIK